MYENHLATREGDERLLFLQRLHPYLGHEHPLRSALEAGCALFVGAEHMNLVKVEEYGEIDGTFYQIQPFLEHLDLRDVSRICHQHKRWIPASEIAILGVQMCEAFLALFAFLDEKATERSAVHRICASPSTFLLVSEGTLKLRKFTEDAIVMNSFAGVGHVGRGFSCYSPEAIKGQPLGEPHLVYVIGAILYECAVLGRLFQGNSTLDTLRGVLEQEAPMAHERRPDFPPSLSRLLQRTLAKDPAQRIPTIQALQEECMAFLHSRHVAFSCARLKGLYRSVCSLQGG